MKTLVERIRNRELAIENDGSLEELNKVVKYCFPKDEALPSKHNKYYSAYLLNFKEWACGIIIDLPAVSVKEVLAEIEGEGKQTKVIYLNEEDKPKIEEPLTPFEWYNNHSPDSDNFEWCALKNSLFEKNVKEYAEYLNNFKPNDKTIEFKKVFGTKNTGWLHNNSLKPSEMDLIIVISNTEFIGIQEDTFHGQWRFKGNLNNGKLKQ